MRYRLATVSFLNAIPLVEMFTAGGAREVELIRALPSELPAILKEGRADAALMPVAWSLANDHATLLGGAGIACHGAVESVKLYLRCGVPEIRRVLADRGSMTSVALSKVLLAEAGVRTAEYRAFKPEIEREPGLDEAMLIIGDRCLEYERSLRAGGARGIRALDLGTAWLELTGLPFVFAAWTAAPDLPARVGPDGIADLSVLLARAREYGIERLEEIAEREASSGHLGVSGEATPDALAYYYRHSLRYRVGSVEMEGLLRFREACADHEIIAVGRPPVTM